MERIFQRRHATSVGGDPFLFADDLAVFQQFAKTETNKQIHLHMHLCHTRVHKWGRVNQVAFDPSKEQVVVIHPYWGKGIRLSCWACS